MYTNNLKILREKNNYTQEDISSKFGYKIDIYNQWESSNILIPINVLDELSIFYNVKISYLLGIEKDYKINYEIKPINSNVLSKNLKYLKKQKKHTYRQLSKYLNCTENACKWYFNGLITLPTDKLIHLSELYDIKIDELCGKE